MGVIITIAVCAFVLRYWMRRKYPLAIGYDVFYYLSLSQLIRDNGNKFLTYRPANYPYKHLANQGYPWLLSFLDRDRRMAFERISSPLLDAFGTVLIGLACASFSALNPGMLPDGAPIMAAAMYAFCPALLRVGSGPRSYSGTPRVAGETLYLLHAVLALYAIQTGSILAGALSVMAGAFIVITAVFGNQVMVFFGLVIGLFASGWYLLMLAGSFVLALLVFKGTAWNSLKGQVTHTWWYYTFYRHVHFGLSTRTLADYLKSWREHGRAKLEAGKYKNFLFWCLDEQFYPHYVLVCWPAALLAFGSLAVDTSGVGYSFLSAWFLAAMVVSLAAKTRFLLPLGEGERYIEYAALPIFLLALTVLRDQTAMAWGLTALGVASGLFCTQRVPALLDEIETAATAHRDAVEALNDLPDGTVMVFGYSAYQGLLWGNKEMVGFVCDEERAFMDEEDFRVFFANLPLPAADFDDVRSRFGFRYIYGQKWAFDRYRSLVQDAEAFDAALTLHYENDQVAIYEVSDSVN